jgi:hypothetical protein
MKLLVDMNLSPRTGTLSSAGNPTVWGVLARLTRRLHNVSGDGDEFFAGNFGNQRQFASL